MASTLARTGALLVTGAAMSGAMALVAGPASAAPASPATKATVVQAGDSAEASARKCRSTKSEISKRVRVTGTICWTGKNFTANGTIKDLSPRDKYVRVGVQVRYSGRVVRQFYPSWTSTNQKAMKYWRVKDKGSKFVFRACMKDSWSNVKCSSWK
ncbi:hypothetical protein [Actinomadura rudentiformis]|uniref:SH3 domain-containing protein n=1 Tax=Actinomadura rudentiformis TaxID=359158 RepID=A0A6H9Z2S2_9ACTN|nr:hypothetical protein [Actinomadura rudentiformis]KAB2348576.1 hypothetical protein F8566_17540 [Actinomadura rudentiformis]